MINYKIIEFPKYEEEDGSLVVAEVESQIPFEIKRFFCISDVPEKSLRANHAAMNSQFVFCVMKGSVSIELDDGASQVSIRLKDSTKAIFVDKAI